MSEGSAAPQVITFTEEWRQGELERGRRSLFHFARAILGFDKLGELQLDLAHFLEGRQPYGPWFVACVCMYRGGYKSTLTTQAYPLWRALYSKDFSCRIVENSSQNAKVNHFLPMVSLFTSSRQADYLQWLYQDRIPTGFEGWNSNQICFIQENPLKKPSITYQGKDSRSEGWHGDLVLLDDLDGADADKGTSGNELSYRAYQAAYPLLEEPSEGQICVVGTPHGSDPIVWTLRNKELEGSLDNSKRRIKVFWRPVLKPDGKPYEPHRFPQPLIEVLSREEMWAEQYMLEKRSGGQGIFNEERIIEAAPVYLDVARRIIRYRTSRFDPDKMDESGYVIPEEKQVVVRASELRTFMHVDPTHKLQSEMQKSSLREQRTSYNAIVVAGVASDNHVFILDFYEADSTLDDLVNEMARLHRKWKCYKVTVESVGAQVWLKPYVKLKEQGDRIQLANMQHIGLNVGRAMSDASLTSRIEPANKTTQSKEWLYREGLAPWVNQGMLHLHPQYHHTIVKQMTNLSDDKQPLDLLDCLSQGPDVWRPPVDGAFLRSREKGARDFVDRHLVRGSTHGRSPYKSPIERWSNTEN